MTIEYKTWTRRENAVKAVQKILEKTGGFTKPLKLDAEGEKSAFSVVVRMDASQEEKDCLQKILEDTARVEGAEYKDPSPTDLNEIDEALEGTFADKIKDQTPAPKKAPKKRGPQKDRLTGRKIYTNGENPYREGTKSHRTYAWVQDNEGVTFATAKEAGCRALTIYDALRKGWMTNSTQ